MQTAVYPELQGKVVLITGATRGIGRGIAEAFACQGCRVAATGRDEAAGAEVLKALKKGNGEALFSHLDVTDRSEAERVVNHVEDRFGPVDILVNNAGVSDMHLVVDLTDESWDYNMDINAKGVFIMCQIVVRKMIERAMRGRIINIASIGGKVAVPYLAHYCASKFAVIGFTQGLALEVAQHGIKVNAVCPGYTRTSMQEREIKWESELKGIPVEEVKRLYHADIPLGSIAEPEDIAKVVIFMASDFSDYMTGQAINVSGGACLC
jgi:NAD(P)-dependent dehydrogenase (short-subunit alcohol dehydrogenase family)